MFIMQFYIDIFMKSADKLMKRGTLMNGLGFVSGF